MAEETQKPGPYLDKLKTWGLWVAAVLAALLVQFALQKLGVVGSVPQPPPPVIVVSPDQPVSVTIHRE
jgi:hypothetical protein